MKKLILTILIFIAGFTAKSQIWQADTLRYFKDVLNKTSVTKPDTMLVEEIYITIEDGKINIVKEDAEFNARIVDTLEVDWMTPDIYIKNYAIRTVATRTGKIYEMELHMMYFRDEMVSLGLSRGGQLFLYHINNKLINGNARRHSYLND